MTLTSMPSCPRAAAGEDPTPHPSVYFSDAMKKRSLGLRAPKSWDMHTWVTQCSFSSVQFSSVQSLGHVRLFLTPWTAPRQAFLSITNSQSLPKLMSIESVMPSNHLILRCPLLLLPSIFPSTRVFPNESVLCIRWLKYWSFSFSSRILEWVAYPFSRGSS